MRHQKGPSPLREVESLIFFNLAPALQTLNKADRIDTHVLQYYDRTTLV